VRFRLNTSQRDARSESNPYPVLVGAIRRAAYKRKVTAHGLENWADTVAGAARGTITSWVAERHMNDLIPPPRMGEQAGQPPPPPYRQALHERFYQKDTRRKFADMGAEIVWVSVGHLRPDPDVDPDLKPEADPTGRGERCDHRCSCRCARREGAFAGHGRDGTGERPNAGPAGCA
jgi:hypothetical protein